jgi:hypothetical protein
MRKILTLAFYSTIIVYVVLYTPVLFHNAEFLIKLKLITLITLGSTYCLLFFLNPKPKLTNSLKLVCVINWTCLNCLILLKYQKVYLFLLPIILAGFPLIWIELKTRFISKTSTTNITNFQILSILFFSVYVYLRYFHQAFSTLFFLAFLITLSGYAIQRIIKTIGFKSLEN